MKLVIVLIGLVALHSSLAKSVGNLKSFSYSNCGSPTDTVTLNQLVISPDPVIIPGDVTFSQSITAINGIQSPTQGDYLFEYEDETGAWKQFPCIDGSTDGPCHYSDICLFLDFAYPPASPCPQYFIDKNVPCRCPFPPGTYAFEDLVRTFTSTSVPKTRYHARINLYTDTEQLTCYDIYFTVA